MAYVGNNLTVQQYAPQIAYFSGNASQTAFTLPVAVVTAAQIIVAVENVIQNPSSAFSISGATLTFTSAPPSGTNNIWVEYTSLTTAVYSPPPGYSEFASGTNLIFQQTTAPTGWTKVTVNNDAALRVVSGSASTGGSVGFTTAFASQAVSGTVGTSGSTTATGTIGGTAITTAQMPSHSHGVSDPGHYHTTGNIDGGANRGYTAFGSEAGLNGTYPTNTVGTGISIQSNGSGQTHTHSLAMDAHTHTGGTFTGTAINLAVKYVDVITATKD